MSRAIATDRVVVVGAGLAGLIAALALAPRPTLVVAPEPLGCGASSASAQGGVAAAVGLGDSPAAHAADTVAAGAGSADPEVARVVTEAAPAAVARLAALGAPFDRDAAGGFRLSREAAHDRPRIVRCGGDQAGRRIMEALVAAVRASASIQVIEDAALVGIETEGGRVVAARHERAARPSQPVRLRAPAFLLAGGGLAGLYALTTNPKRIRGQILGAAARAGAVVADAEFVQFHPTAIDVGADPAPLATEALRGEGAILINALGERFMLAAHPDAELAPRDVVARAVFAETRAGRRPALDVRAVFARPGAPRFPAVAAACARAGLDPTRRPIPVAAAAHYHMGGIATDLRGRSSLAGLWVCGEAAATGLHGANRLASNGLLEAVVMAEAAARDIASAAALPAPAAAVALGFEDGGAAPDPALVAALRRVMTEQVGVVRDGAGLTAALARIAAIEAAGAASESLRNMTAAATLVAAAALERRESRGAHFRADFPAPDPAQAGRRRITLADTAALRVAPAEAPA